ncbi:MAG: response regulator [Candidatus Krumholzibacteriia bacterium]
MNVARILLVDDEEVFVQNMQRLLTNRGYTVTTASSGEDALDRLSERAYDVVVLDLRMPGQGGLSTLKAIKRRFPLVEVLILTGHGAIDSALEAMRAGAYDYITKPCEVDDLTRKLENAREHKDGAERSEMEDRIQKLIESPLSVLDLVREAKQRRK